LNSEEFAEFIKALVKE
jgi:Ca2+-binding EF-hand superfamily protein